MPEFARLLSGPLRRAVVDRTGLNGYFDADFDVAAELAPPLPPGASDQRNSTSLVSIVTVLQEQLGLKLESQRGPVDVLVIDSVEHPLPDLAWLPLRGGPSTLPPCSSAH